MRTSKRSPARQASLPPEQRDTYNVAAEDEGSAAGGCAANRTTTPGTRTGWVSCGGPQRQVPRCSGCGWHPSRTAYIRWDVSPLQRGRRRHPPAAPPHRRYRAAGRGLLGCWVTTRSSWRLFADAAAGGFALEADPDLLNVRDQVLLRV